jgi:hypothetical protein
VFIHRDPCERYEGTTLPETLRPLPLALEGYGQEGALLMQRRVGAARFEDAVEDVFAHAGVQFAHLRNAEAGCFIARLDRH